MRINLTNVLVDDQEKALHFYTDVLGFVKKHDIDLGAARWLTVVSPQEPDGVELLLEPDEHPAARPFKEALVSDVFKALADPTRRAILDELTDRDGQTLFEICARLATKHRLTSSRQAISQHLDVLEDAGLVTTRREGRYKFHHIDTTPLETIGQRWPRRKRGS